MIHKTAIIDPKAKIDKDVSIGAYSIIGPDVQIGSKTIIQPHVNIIGDTLIGKNNKSIVKLNNFIIEGGSEAIIEGMVFLGQLSVFIVFF